MNPLGRRVRATVVIVAGVSLAPTGAAFASQPVVPNCVGTTFSGAAHALEPGALGAVVTGFAQAPDGQPGLGDGILALQAGGVPDEIANNTCND